MAKPQRERPLERLVDARPEFVGERRGWVSFDCPIHDECMVAIPVTPPMDGGAATHAGAWAREGDTFETLTLAPSIAVRGGENGCEWHGFVRAGRFETLSDSR